MVRLTIGGSKKSYAIHRLVAEVFLQNPKKLPIVYQIPALKAKIESPR